MIRNTRTDALLLGADSLLDSPPSIQPLYQPFFLSVSGTKNAKVIALAVSSLQRLIALGEVPAVCLSPFRLVDSRVYADVLCWIQ